MQPPHPTPHLRGHKGMALGETMKQPRLFAFRDGRDSGMDGFGGKLAICDICRRLGSRLHEVGVDAEEFEEGFQPAGQRADAWKRLQLVISPAAAVRLAPARGDRAGASPRRVNRPGAVPGR